MNRYEKAATEHDKACKEGEPLWSQLTDAEREAKAAAKPKAAPKKDEAEAEK